LQEWLGFINSELHKAFGPLFNPKTPEDYKTIARQNLTNRLGYVAGHLAKNDYLMGKQFTVADGYLYTVLNWGQWTGIDVKQWPALVAFQERVASRPSVRAAQAAEAAKT
jgi:glutathione S-transferase